MKYLKTGDHPQEFYILHHKDHSCDIRVIGSKEYCENLLKSWNGGHNLVMKRVYLVDAS